MDCSAPFSYRTEPQCEYSGLWCEESVLEPWWVALVLPFLTLLGDKIHFGRVVVRNVFEKTAQWILALRMFPVYKMLDCDLLYIFRTSKELEL